MTAKSLSFASKQLAVCFKIILDNFKIINISHDGFWVLQSVLYLVIYKNSGLKKLSLKKNFNIDHLVVIYRNNADTIYLSHISS